MLAYGAVMNMGIFSADRLHGVGHLSCAVGFAGATDLARELASIELVETCEAWK